MPVTRKLPSSKDAKKGVKRHGTGTWESAVKKLHRNFSAQGFVSIAGSQLRVAAGIAVVVVLRPELSHALDLQGYEAIRLRLSDDGHLLLQTQVRNQQVVFVVDTGAPTGFLSEAKAASLGLPVDSPRPGQREETVTVSDLSLGHIRLNNVIFGVGRLPKSTSYFEGAMKAVHGLLGSDILGHYQAIIDCRQREIFLKTAGAATDPSPSLERVGYVPIPFHKSRWLYVPVGLRDRKFSAIIDTGSSLTILQARPLRAIALPTQPTSVWVSGFNIAGQRLRRVPENAHDLRIGDAPVPMAFNMIASDRLFGDQPSDFVGIIGTDLLIRHSAVIDFGRGLLWLQKPE